MTIDRQPGFLPQPRIDSFGCFPLSSSHDSLAALAEGGESSRKDKGPAAFKTISETSKILGVPQHVLRFWESRFRQIRPLKLKGGRRYYRPEDVELLLRIKRLLYQQGYTIKGARKALNDARRNKLEYLAQTMPTAMPDDDDFILGDEPDSPSPSLMAQPVARPLPRVTAGGMKVPPAELDALKLELAKLKAMLSGAMEE